MKIQNFLLLSLLAMVAACAPAEKFPYPPQYVTVEQVPPTILPPPPAVGSPEYTKALNAVIARQKKLSPHEIRVVKSEDRITQEMIVNPVLGKSITAEKFPKLYEHLRRAASDSWRIRDAASDYWGSPRPWYVDSRVKIHVNRITHPGYPSGHTTTNTVAAYILGDLFPCKQPALLARANAIGYHRVAAGAHFDFDIEAGKTLATAIYARMPESPNYQTEHAAVREEVRDVNLCQAR